MLYNTIRVTLLSLLLAVPAVADELDDTLTNVCEKVKACAVEKMATRTLTAQERQQMQPMLENICQVLKTDFVQVKKGQPAYEPAVACMRSMEALDCEQMQDPEKSVTPDCKSYEALMPKPAAAP